MELKPMKKNENVSYPTVKEISNSNELLNMFTALSVTGYEILPVAVPCYVAIPSNAGPIALAQLIRMVSIITTLLSSILFFINKFKSSKSIKEQLDEEKIKKISKRKKIYCYLLWIGIVIIIISTLFIFLLENLM